MRFCKKHGKLICDNEQLFEPIVQKVNKTFNLALTFSNFVHFSQELGSARLCFVLAV